MLQSLLEDDWQRIQGHLQPITLNLGQVLAEMGDDVEWVIFPEIGLISVISILITGAAVETSVVGHEGAIGFVEALGSAKMHSRLLVQVEGRGFRIRAEDFRSAFRSSPEMQTAVHRQVELLQAESRLAIACHSVHKVEARLSRWLLECHDLSGGVETLPLTQELLAIMLAVQRTTVTKCAKALQDAKLIRYTRGRIELLNANGLEDRACECRATLQQLRAELAPETFSRPPVRCADVNGSRQHDKSTRQQPY